MIAICTIRGSRRHGRLSRLTCARYVASFVLALVATPAWGPPASWGAPAPAEHFAELPTFAGLDLAPDGKHIAMLRAFNGRYHLTVLDVQEGSSELLLAGNRQHFRWCRFANDERILCAISQPGGAQPGRAVARRARTRLMAVNIDGGVKLTLLPAALGEGMAAPTGFQDRVVSWLPEDPEHVLLAVQADASRVRIVRVNIYTNAQEPVGGALPLLESWFADVRGEVRIGVGFVGTNFRLVTRPPGADDFAPLPDWSGQGVTPLRVLGVSADGTAFHAALRGGSGRIGVYELSLAQGSILRQVLEDPRFDFDGKLAYGPDGSLVAAFHTRDLPAARFFEPTWQAQMDQIAQLVNHDVVLPVSWDRSGKRLVVVALGSSTPSSHYFYDAQTSDLLHLGASHRLIGPQGNVRSTQYVARDGVTIPAYLTLPRGRSARRLPAVIMPHDGPAARDDARFDYLVQFLASRGYAVLQPNFRGSRGYGREYLDAGYRQWGLKMQDDVVDGIDWLVKQGIADPGRICMLGRGYGGYVAVMASIETPRKVRCAISLGGIFDLHAMVTNLRLFGFDRLNRRLILSAMSDSPGLEANSPAYNAPRVGVPLLLLHGAVDRVVPVEQTHRLVRALAAAGREYRYVEQLGGDHALSGESQRLRFLEEVEAFLAFYL